MPPVPRDPAPDSTLSLLSEGYGFIPNRCRRHGSDIFETRLMLRRVICISGEEAARLFYGSGRFTRNGAMPQTTLRLLQDKGSVQLLDDGMHRVRKGMFMTLLSPDGIRRLTQEMVARWEEAVGRWQGMGRVVLFDEVRNILCRAVCAWAGIPLDEEEARRRAREFEAMIDGAGAVGPRNWRGLLLRRRTEGWARGIIDRARAGEFEGPEESVLHVLANHRDADGASLDRTSAAVELINLLRPTVAVDRYVVFAALALHRHPECRQALMAGGEEERECFVQEVRRFYPFFPFIGGRVRQDFTWKGYDFAKGAWVLLDLYGTNHDPRLWTDPGAFRPDRFRGWQGSGFDLIPQGAGHPGEPLRDRPCQTGTVSGLVQVPIGFRRLCAGRC